MNHLRLFEEFSFRDKFKSIKENIRNFVKKQRGDIHNYIQNLHPDEQQKLKKEVGNINKERLATKADSILDKKPTDQDVVKESKLNEMMMPMGNSFLILPDASDGGGNMSDASVISLTHWMFGTAVVVVCISLFIYFWKKWKRENPDFFEEITGFGNDRHWYENIAFGFIRVWCLAQLILAIIFEIIIFFSK